MTHRAGMVLRAAVLLVAVAGRCRGGLAPREQRALLGDEPSDAEATVTFVDTPSKLQQSVEDGEKQLVILDHLDLTTLPASSEPDNQAGSESPAILHPSTSTESMIGNCSSTASLDRTNLLPLLPSQCVISTKASIISLGQDDQKLWMDRLYLHMVRSMAEQMHSNESYNMISLVGSARQQLWLTSMIIHGDGIPGARAFLMDSSTQKAVAKDTILANFESSSGVAAFVYGTFACLNCTVQDCEITDGNGGTIELGPPPAAVFLQGSQFLRNYAHDIFRAAQSIKTAVFSDNDEQDVFHGNSRQLQQPKPLKDSPEGLFLDTNDVWLIRVRARLPGLADDDIATRCSEGEGNEGQDTGSLYPQTVPPPPAADPPLTTAASSSFGIGSTGSSTTTRSVSGSLIFAIVSASLSLVLVAVLVLLLWRRSSITRQSEKQELHESFYGPTSAGSSVWKLHGPSFNSSMQYQHLVDTASFRQLPLDASPVNTHAESSLGVHSQNFSESNALYHHAFPTGSIALTNAATPCATPSAPLSPAMDASGTPSSNLKLPPFYPPPTPPAATPGASAMEATSFCSLHGSLHGSIHGSDGMLLTATNPVFISSDWPVQPQTSSPAQAAAQAHMHATLPSHSRKLSHSHSPGHHRIPSIGSMALNSAAASATVPAHSPPRSPPSSPSVCASPTNYKDADSDAPPEDTGAGEGQGDEDKSTVVVHPTPGTTGGEVAAAAPPDTSGSAPIDIGAFGTEMLQLCDVLDDMYDANELLFNEYRLYSGVERRAGGQGVVQFCVRDQTRQEYAVKFFGKAVAFERERTLYSKPALKSVLPECTELWDNEDGRFRAPGGYIFPPFCIIEKGESLDEFALNVRHERITVIQALTVVVSKLRMLHMAGWAHRDLKPSNVLRIPRLHSWALIDLGCAAKIGAEVPVSFSLAYTAPEIIAAVESSSSTITATAAADIWALGVIAYELLTQSKVFPMGTTADAMCDALAGRSLLPWEADLGRAAPLSHLKKLKSSVMQCLRREPALRPDATALLAAWTNLFEGETRSSCGSAVANRQTT